MPEMHHHGTAFGILRALFMGVTKWSMGVLSGNVNVERLQFMLAKVWAGAKGC